MSDDKPSKQKMKQKQTPSSDAHDSALGDDDAEVAEDVTDVSTDDYTHSGARKRRQKLKQQQQEREHSERESFTVSVDGDGWRN